MTNQFKLITFIFLSANSDHERISQETKSFQNVRMRYITVQTSELIFILFDRIDCCGAFCVEYINKCKSFFTPS